MTEYTQKNNCIVYDVTHVCSTVASLGALAALAGAWLAESGLVVRRVGEVVV